MADIPKSYAELDWTQRGQVDEYLLHRMSQQGFEGGTFADMRLPQGSPAPYGNPQRGERVSNAKVWVTAWRDYWAPHAGEGKTLLDPAVRITYPEPFKSTKEPLRTELHAAIMERVIEHARVFSSPELNMDGRNNRKKLRDPKWVAEQVNLARDPTQSTRTIAEELAEMKAQEQAKALKPFEPFFDNDSTERRDIDAIIKGLSEWCTKQDDDKGRCA